MATEVTMTASVKATESQRWNCRIQLLQCNGTSSEDRPRPEAGRAHGWVRVWHCSLLDARGPELPARRPRPATRSLPAERLRHVREDVPHHAEERHRLLEVVGVD